MKSWYLLPEQCQCGGSAVLRVRFRTTVSTVIDYLRYECRKCEHKGALSITEPEAAETFRAQ